MEEWKYFISGGVAILIFISGQLSVTLRERYKKKKEEKHLRKYFIEQVKLLHEPIERQVKILRTFSEKLENIEGGTWKFNTVPMNHFHLFKSIDYSMLYSSFTRGKHSTENGELYGRIVSRLFNFEDYPIKIDKSFQKFSNLLISNKKDYKFYLDQLRIKSDNLKVEYDLDVDSTILTNALFVEDWIELYNNTIVKNSRNKEYFERMNFRRKYLIPLEKICIKHHDLIGVSEIHEYVKQLSMIDKDYEDIMINYSKVFTQHANNGEIVFKQILDSIDGLKLT